MLYAIWGNSQQQSSAEHGVLEELARFDGDDAGGSMGMTMCEKPRAKSLFRDKDVWALCMFNSCALCGHRVGALALLPWTLRLFNSRACSVGSRVCALVPLRRPL
eukprot:gnl/TRDRNA2_/TRDRNA2_174146_c0_seq3.p2 gnl/TRDRNA2_/TRDRNA2_174146_c0~~gnl/TRDRNA2_/TRDRNA2_174146_c0_seq3.p2  ORF type:complete len:105 (+),score=14.33 gnl/TRDRNA2_/TRDRNA2_174146_c0_seq3:465-779(+)